MRIALMIAVLGCLFGACSPLLQELGIKEDGPFEEAGEDLLKDLTGIDKDFSEESPEK